MATFRHGKNQVVLWGRYNLTSYFNDAKFERTGDVADTTTFGDSDKTYIKGQADSKVMFSGLFEGSTLGTQDVLTAALASSADIITYCPEGATRGQMADLIRAHESKFAVSAVISDVVKATVEAQGTTMARRGHLLHTLATAITSTGSLTPPHDSGVVAGTTGGGVAHFHLVTQSTLTSFITKVQHSSANVSWSDLITFTATTAETVQRSTVSGTVKRYTREIVTTFTGGAGKSVTQAVAFARKAPGGVL